MTKTDEIDTSQTLPVGGRSFGHDPYITETIERMAADRRRLRAVHSRTLVTPEVRAQSIERWRVEDRVLLAYEAALVEEAIADDRHERAAVGYWRTLWRALWGQA